jgi:hypothetical protein
MYHLKKSDVINLPKAICHFLLGQEHHIAHRMIAGVVIMGIGVVTAKSAHAATSEVGQISLDMVGYAVHGLGAVPFVSYLIEE